LVNEENYKQVKYDSRLTLSLDFVCKILDVTNEDFASLAISNLLVEELDWIKHNYVHDDFAEIEKHKVKVKVVKFEADGWVLSRR